MAIRIRNVGGVVVALCAVESDAKAGDIYLDDAAHHALSTKFGLDWKSMGFIDDPPIDEECARVMESQKVRDAKEEIEKWVAENAAAATPTGFGIKTEVTQGSPRTGNPGLNDVTPLAYQPESESGTRGVVPHSKASGGPSAGGANGSFDPIGPLGSPSWACPGPTLST